MLKTLTKLIDRLYWLLIKYKYQVQNMTISFLLTNFVFFYAYADFKHYTPKQQNFWDALWYVVEAWLYVLFSLVFTALNFKKSYRAIWAILTFFLSIRAIWTISAVIFGVSVNEKKAMAAMFCLTFLTICIIALYPQIMKIINLWEKRFGARGH